MLKLDIIPYNKTLLRYTFQDRFQDPKSLVNDLHENGFKAIWMLDPGIKQEDGYFVYDSGSKTAVWISKADGTPFVGNFSLPIGFEI